MQILVIPPKDREVAKPPCDIPGVSVVLSRFLDQISQSQHVVYLNTGEYEPSLLADMGQRARAAKIDHSLVSDERDLPRRIEDIARKLAGLPPRSTQQIGGWANDALTT